MSKDIEVLAHLVSSLGELVNKLEKSVSENKIEETNKVKSIILEVNSKIIEESK